MKTEQKTIVFAIVNQKAVSVKRQPLFLWVTDWRGREKRCC